MSAFVLNSNGEKLMPTTNKKKIRKLLKSGKAVIFKYHPFTIKLTYLANNDTQDVEFKADTGYLYDGVSLCSEKHEYESAEYTTLKDEKQHHEDCLRYRRQRRNHKRYRKARFSNCKKEKGCLAPSLEHKKDLLVAIFKMYYEVCPITKATIEVGQFDIQELMAIEEGKPLPKGKDYQQGERYGYDTLREAVFARDNHKCIICGKTDVPLRTHHLGFWRNDHSNKMSNIATVCGKCHIPKNHKPDGKLWGLGPTKGFKEPAFMNTVKWQIYEEIKKFGIETHITYGAKTKRTRKSLNIEKSHANDAYCIGEFRPKHRSKTKYYEKRRRNNRVLEKFYDAKYIDSRDGSIKKGAEIGTNRPNRSVPRDNENNERKYRKEKVSKGHRNIRKQRTKAPVGSIILYNEKIYISGGTQHYGEYTLLKGELNSNNKPKAVKTADIKVLSLPSGWIKI